MSELQKNYRQSGYAVLRNFYSPLQLQPLHRVLRDFHLQWLADNSEAYQKHAINSAYITQSKVLGAAQRGQLFAFIGSNQLSEPLLQLLPEGAAFMNTQLFFDPFNAEQKNYWHRDIQFNPISIKQQQQQLRSSNVMHFRIALKPERGLELVPGTHLRWDTPAEYAVRSGAEGHHPSDDLAQGRAIALDAGDLLIFSANMIHRGLYGMDRFAFDCIFCDADPELLAFADSDCLPDAEQLAAIENPLAFSNTIALKGSAL
jgi:ectoine hydroxylase-related dioxygenase (phytanoyl-CoA dioxygenase family)